MLSMEQKNSFVLSLLSGAAAGTGVDLILFPIDTIKTRLQSSKGFRASGGFRGIYSGLPSTLVGTAPTSALFFTTYDTVKTKLNFKSDTVNQILAANTGEVFACSIRVPVDVIKQRSQAQPHLTTFVVFKDTLVREGLRGFYRSYLTTVLREIPFATIQFPLWEHLKLVFAYYSKDQKCSPYQSAICGAIAGGIAAGLTTPLDVVKTRLTLSREAHKYKDNLILNTMRDLYREKGVKGLFAGISARVTMISIGGFIFFGIYEKTKAVLTNVI